MNRADYIRMLDSGMDSQEISKVLQQREDAPTEAFNWKATEHLETDFVNKPAMDIHVEADVHDKPPSQRLFGTPIYDQNGDMRCRCCGQVMSRSLSGSGEGIASCFNVGCNANGFAYAEGSYTRNPHRAVLR
jgi:hypothetical protein